MQQSLSASPVLDAYCAELRSWLRGKADDHALKQAGIALCSNAHDQRLSAEQILMALHARGLPALDGVGRDKAVQDQRYVHAVRLLMESYFGGEAR